jgi:hypothetical protein
MEPLTRFLFVKNSSSTLARTSIIAFPIPDVLLFGVEIAQFPLYLLFIVLSFAAVLHKLFPIMIIEASLFNILIPYSITVFIFMKNIHKMNNNDIIQILLSLAAGLIIILTRTWVLTSLLLVLS